MSYGADETVDRQSAAAHPEIACGKRRISSLAARPQPSKADHLRQLWPGSGRQTRARLPHHSGQFLLQEYFPSDQTICGKSSVNDFMTTAQGFRMSTSVGGVLTGRGADMLAFRGLPLGPWPSAASRLA